MRLTQGFVQQRPHFKAIPTGQHQGLIQVRLFTNQADCIIGQLGHAALQLLALRRLQRADPDIRDAILSRPQGQIQVGQLT